MKTHNLRSIVCFWSLLSLLLSGSYAFSDSPCQLSLQGDLNRDCKVDITDLSWLASYWLTDWTNQTGSFLPDGIYVSTQGFNSGTCGSMYQPCRTINQGLIRAVGTSKYYVFVADGIYEENVTVANGINLLGGFDAMTWVRKEAGQSSCYVMGAASTGNTRTLTADSITAATEVSRFQIRGSESTQAGRNSYAVWIRNSNSNFVLKDNYIFAARGTDGSDGADGTGGMTVDGAAGTGALDSMGTVISNDWMGFSGSAGADATSGGKGGYAGGGAFAIFLMNSTPSSNKPTLNNNVIYAGRGGNGGNGGFGGIGSEEGVGGGGGGGAGGLACGLYTWNVTGSLSYHVSNSFAGTCIGGNGGKGGKSFGNSGTAAVAGSALNYYYHP